LAAAIAALAIAPPAVADEGGASARTIEACILAASDVYHEPAAVLLILLNVEGGTLGAVMIDDMFDHIRDLRAEPVWRKLPDAFRTLRA
jgi:hypothetical protein